MNEVIDLTGDLEEEINQLITRLRRHIRTSNAAIGEHINHITQIAYRMMISDDIIPYDLLLRVHLLLTNAKLFAGMRFSRRRQEVFARIHRLFRELDEHGAFIAGDFQINNELRTAFETEQTYFEERQREERVRRDAADRELAERARARESDLESEYEPYNASDYGSDVEVAVVARVDDSELGGIQFQTTGYCLCGEQFRSSEIENLRIMPCFHVICEECMRNHISRNPRRCPYCRGDF